jgi:hypothetical protein
MLEERSTPAIIKIDCGEIRLCFTIQVFDDIPKNFRPKIALQPEMLKDSEWIEATKNLALVVLPTLAPIPFGKEIKSTMLDNDFLKKMIKISPENGFWAKMMVDAFVQEDSDHDTLPIVRPLPKAAIPAVLPPKVSAMHGPQILDQPLIPPALERVTRSNRQKSRNFFIVTQRPRVPQQSRRMGMTSLNWFLSTAQTRVQQDQRRRCHQRNNQCRRRRLHRCCRQHTCHFGRGSTVEHPGKEFYDQLIATMKNFAAPQH